MKRKEWCTVLSQEELTAGIYSMWFQTETIAADAKPGQFISLYCQDGARLLPRPISLCEIDKDGGCLRIVYRVAGKGTKEFSAKKQVTKSPCWDRWEMDFRYPWRKERPCF